MIDIQETFIQIMAELWVTLSFCFNWLGSIVDKFIPFVPTLGAIVAIYSIYKYILTPVLSGGFSDKAKKRSKE